jgi:DNA-binding CsgD family transcriptional regulator
LKSVRAKLGAKTRTAVVSIVQALPTENAGAPNHYDNR